MVGHINDCYFELVFYLFESRGVFKVKYFSLCKCINGCNDTFANRLIARMLVILTGQRILEAGNALSHLRLKQCPSEMLLHLRCAHFPCASHLSLNKVDSFFIYTSRIGRIMEYLRIPRTSLVSVT